MRVPLLLALLCLGACSQPKAVSPEQAAAITPSDGRLAALYETSCKTCHTIAGSGAPLTGDARAWEARMKQGMPMLVAHTVQGFRAMPAGGQCAACTAADFEALIVFMSKEP